MPDVLSIAWKLLAAGLFYTAFVLSAWGGGVQISPLSLELSLRARVAVLSFINNSARPIDLEAEVLTWSQANGSEEKTPTDEILISPPFTTVQPGKTQLFRVALRQPLPPASERAYRVMITDVSEPVAAAGNAIDLQIRISHSVPLFLQTIPKGEPKLIIDACRSAENEVCVRVRNDGARHAGLSQITMNSEGWTHQLTANSTLLAGGTLSFRTPVSQLKSSVIEVTINADGATYSGSIAREAP